MLAWKKDNDQICVADLSKDKDVRFFASARENLHCWFSVRLLHCVRGGLPNAGYWMIINVSIEFLIANEPFRVQCK
jgi:hypothetical protein